MANSVKTITVLGSTGSVGRQVLDVISKKPRAYKVVGLSGYTNGSLLREQIKKFNCDYYFYPKENLTKQLSIFDGEHVYGATPVSSLEELASTPADIVVSAVGGIAGLWAAVAVLKRGGTLAIANKETIIAAGRHLKALEKKYGGKILPLDTEHSAIFCCLRGEDKSKVSRLILTASGGALRDMPLSDLKKVTPELALNHPVWKMGKKVTIDSATLFNKGLEVIEAMRLFEVPYDKVDVLMHRESIIHSLVEFSDNSVKALLSVPDMRLSIDIALNYPTLHGVNSVDKLDLAKIGELHFSAPDFERYPCLKICMDAAKLGDGASIAISAADEVLVEEFLKGTIPFTKIASVLSRVLNKFKDVGNVKLDDILIIDGESRKYTYSILGVR